MQLITRSECLHLTWPGRLLLLVVTLSLLLLVMLRIHPFLAVNEPQQKANILIVEGWMPGYAMDQVKQLFDNGNYQHVLITGGELQSGHHLSKYRTHAQLGAKKLARLGIPVDIMTEIPSPSVLRNRTFVSAIAVRDWLDAQGKTSQSINIVTLGTHATRTHLLYGYAFGGKDNMGIISIPNKYYDPEVWWLSSEGLRSIIGETIGWLYARFVFSAP